MAKIRRAGGGKGLKVGDKVVYKEDPDEVGVIEDFEDGEVVVRWAESPAISWEIGADLVKYKEHEREYNK